MTPWQPRVIRDSAWAIDVAQEPAWRSSVARAARAVFRQRGYIVRTTLRLGFAVAALLTMPTLPALLVAGVMAAAQFLCDEPAPSQNAPRPSLKSVP